MPAVILAETAEWLRNLPAVNASLNGLATVLLMAGYVFIINRKESAHKWSMGLAFLTSVIFLGCYLTYHYAVGSVRFEGPPAVRMVYLVILVSHIVLAMAVPVLAIGSILTGWWAIHSQDPKLRRRHRLWSKVTFPIWLYVSVTGVVIYLMLYQIWPAPV